MATAVTNRGTSGVFEDASVAFASAPLFTGAPRRVSHVNSSFFGEERIIHSYNIPEAGQN